MLSESDASGNPYFILDFKGIAGLRMMASVYFLKTPTIKVKQVPFRYTN